MRISANGGTPELMVKNMGLYLVNPQLLPDGKTVFFGIVKGSKDSQIAVQSPKSDKPKVLFEGGNARYLPTGHLVYGLRNSLYAIPFNLDRLEASGGSVPLIEAVFQERGIYTPQFAVSNSGTLVYIHGTSTADVSQLTLLWVDRKGNEVRIAAAPKDYGSPSISPDGTKLALAISTGEDKSDIWIYDLARETMTRLTFNENSDDPLWTPDGKRIVFRSGSPVRWAVYWKAADGTGGDEVLIPEQDLRGFIPLAWSKDGRTLILFGGTLPGAIYTLPLEGDRKVKTLLRDEKYAQLYPKISPDGRWMAYESNESKQYEVYVRPFADADKGKWQVSTSGGTRPLWSPNGRELFYHNGDSVMAVSVEAGQTFKCGKPENLFQGRFDSLQWDISPDGKRFIMLKEAATAAKPAAPEAPRKINIVLNWFEELKQRVPVK